MRCSRVFGIVVTILLLVGQAALSLAGAPCVCRTAVAHDAATCCCGHDQGEPCPCSPGDDGAPSVQGACSHEVLAVTGRSMPEATAGPTTPLPPVAVELPTAPSLAMPHALVLAEWHAPPLRSPRLLELRTVVLRN